MHDPVHCRSHNLYFEAIAHHSDLTPGQRWLAQCAKERSAWATKPNAGQGIPMTVPQWVTLTHMSESSVKSGLKTLVAKGWLRKEAGVHLRGNPRPTPRYDLSIPRDVYTVLGECSQPHRCRSFLPQGAVLLEPRLEPVSRRHTEAPSVVSSHRQGSEWSREVPWEPPLWVQSRSYGEPPF